MKNVQEIKELPYNNTGVDSHIDKKSLYIDFRDVFSALQKHLKVTFL